MALELVHQTTDEVLEDDPDWESNKNKAAPKGSSDKPIEQAIEDAEPAIRDVYFAARSFVLALGDDIQEKKLRLYVAFRRLKNFAAFVVQKKAVIVYLKLDPSRVTFEPGFSRDVSKIGHWATGDVELTLRHAADLKRAEALLARSYEGG